MKKILGFRVDFEKNVEFMSCVAKSISLKKSAYKIKSARHRQNYFLNMIQFILKWKFAKFYVLIYFFILRLMQFVYWFCQVCVS